MAIFLFPIFFGLGFWLITRRRKNAFDDDEEQRGPNRLMGEGETTPISLPRDGSSHLRSLMHPTKTTDATPSIAQEHQGEAGE